MTTAKQILAALERAPAAGLTSRELADKVGKPIASVSAAAGKMQLSGRLDRTFSQEVRVVKQRTIRWHAKQGSS